MADDLAKLRAELNIGAIDTPNFIKAIQAAYQNMPGAGVAQAGLAAGSDLLGGLAGNLYGVGKQALSGQLGNPQAGNQAYADAQQVAQALHYNPPTQAGQDIYNAYNKVGEATGPLPELWNTRMRFTPDDLSVLAKTGIEDIRNFPSDYTNAQAGITRDYSTLGSRAAGATETFGQAIKPLAETINNQVMETGGIRMPMGMPDIPIANYAVKPKGGNWPTNLGSTLPLSEQGALGEHLSKVQYSDPIAVFHKQLEKHYPRGVDNRQLLADFEAYRTKRIGLALDPNSPERYLTNAELSKKIADEFAESYNAGTIGNQLTELRDKKLHTASEIEQALPAYNAWVMGPYQKYITNQMGTGLATDPLLQAVNEGGMPPHEIFGQDLQRSWETESIVKRAAQRREDFPNTMLGYSDTPEKFAALENSPIGKITATTPEGLDYENALDASLYAKTPYSFRDNDDNNGTTKFPVVGKLDRNALISDFLTNPEERTGFKEIRKQVFQDLLSGNISPDKMSNVTPATVTRQMIKDRLAQFKEEQLSKKGAADWIPKRAAAMPTDMAFDDGSKMTVITPAMANVDEAMTARDLGQITIDLNQCVGAGCHATQDYPGHGPFLVPHTGKPPRGQVKYDKYGYLARLKNGDIEIASLKDPQGVSQATIELKLEKPKPIRSSQKEFAVGVWLEDNKTPEDVQEFYNNKMKHGIDLAAFMAVEKFPELQTRLDNYNNNPKKSIEQLKGKDNLEVDEVYVPQMVEWLNKNADNLTDVRELNHLKGIHDLDNHYDSIGGMTREHSHWYSPTVEEFFKKADDERLLPRFFTTDQFAQLATDRGVDLSAEPVKIGGEKPKYPPNATLFMMDMIDYYEPGAIRKSYGGYDRIISYNPETGEVVASEVKKDPNNFGGWIDHPTYGGPRSHNTVPTPQEFREEMGRPMRLTMR